MPFINVSRLTVVALVAVAAVPLVAQQSADDLRAKYLINVPQLPTASESFLRGAPGISSGSPLAFGPNWRDAFAGGGYQQVRGPGPSDGAVSVGFGLGNSTEAVGLEVVITSLSTFRSGFGNRTAFSFKAHHMVGSSSAVAVGLENAYITGDLKRDGTSLYVAASHVIPRTGNSRCFRALTLSGGIGNGRFRFEKDVAEDVTILNAFASAGLLIVDQLSVIADWTGQDLTLGVSIVPFKAFPMIITPALADVTRTANDKPRFILGAGIGMRF